MAFKLTTRNLGEVTVIDVSGRLDIAQGAGTLRDTLQSALAEHPKVVINLTDVSFIDTAGLGELAAAHARAQREGSCLKLTAVPKRVETLFEMTGLDRILNICKSEKDAVESWGTGSFPAEGILSEIVA